MTGSCHILPSCILYAGAQHAIRLMLDVRASSSAPFQACSREEISMFLSPVLHIGARPGCWQTDVPCTRLPRLLRSYTDTDQ